MSEPAEIVGRILYGAEYYSCGRKWEQCGQNLRQIWIDAGARVVSEIKAAGYSVTPSATVFTPDEVVNLNAFQASRCMHPFTCPNRGDGNHRHEGHDTGLLVATIRGWICPYCTYTQDWAHEFMKRGPQKPKISDTIKRLRSERDAARAQLDRIEEYGTEEINAAVELRVKLAENRSLLQELLTAIKVFSDQADWYAQEEDGHHKIVMDWPNFKWTVDDIRSADEVAKRVEKYLLDHKIAKS